MKVKDKVFVVTGAGSGMGRELSIQLVRKGAQVALVDINRKGIQETAVQAGIDRVSFHEVDITDRNSVHDLPTQVLSQLGAVDGLINNAGIIQPFVDVKDLEYAVIEKVMNVNFYGTLYMTKAFLPELLKRPEAHIANVSSMGGFIPFPGQTFYGASKAAVKIFTEGLYSELKGTNVGVTIIHPGAVNTNIMENSEIKNSNSKDSEDKGQKILSAEKAASIMISGIEQNKFRVLVGKDASMLDYLYRFNPKTAVDLIVKKMKKL